MLLCLVVLGGLAEVVGIALALLEVRGRRAALRSYRSNIGSVVATVRFKGATPTMSATGHIETEQPPSPEQRLSALEAESVALHRALAQAEARLREYARQQAANEAENLHLVTSSHIDRLRDFLLEVTGGTTRAFVSLGLLVSGLLLQTVANVLAVVAQR